MLSIFFCIEYQIFLIIVPQIYCIMAIHVEFIYTKYYKDSSVNIQNM